jgi:hypothetical protein
VLQRVTFMSVLAAASVLFAAAPALAGQILQPTPLQPVKQARFLTPSPEEVEFGEVDVHGGGSRQTVTFEHTFPKPVEEKIRSVKLVGKIASGFQIVSDSCSGRILYRSPESCSVEVSFAPGAVGARSATLEVVVKEVEEGEEGEVLEEIEVPLSGEGITGTLTASTSSLGFSAIPYTGASKGEGSQNETEELTIRNTAVAAAVRTDSVKIAGPGASSYSVQWGNCENNYLAPGNTCTVGVRFEPTALGANDAELVITSDASNSQVVVPLEGEGLHGPRISLSSKQALLGEVPIGSSTWQTFTLTNSGDYPLGVQQAALISGTPLMFPVLSDTCSGQEIKPSDSCVVTVGFQPTTVGEKDASILFITSTSLPLNIVGIDGVGVPPAAGVQPATPPVASPQAPVPGAASFSVTLTNRPSPAVQVSPLPPRRPAKVAHSRCKRRKGCQQGVAARRQRRTAALRLWQQR